MKKENFKIGEKFENIDELFRSLEEELKQAENSAGGLRIDRLYECQNIILDIKENMLGKDDELKLKNIQNKWESFYSSGMKDYAKELLNEAGSLSGEYKDFAVEFCIDILRRAGQKNMGIEFFTPEDIGTTWEELENLKNQNGGK